MMRTKTSKSITKNTTLFQTLASILEPFVWYFKNAACILFRPVFGKLWAVTPLSDVGLPWGTLGQIFLTFWKMLGAHWLKMSKIPEQHFDTS